MSTGISETDGCHCCEGLAEPDPVSNDPGLPALRYRVDRQPGFYARMLQSLPLARADASLPDSPRPLARLLARDSNDPTVALLDASACVADVLTFYQERIANEGFLRTATERYSVLQLARTIGYELKPGVAASVYLAFTVEDAAQAPGVCTLAAGTPVQSVPPQGKLPQVFETSDDLVARAEWNALLPRQTRPADMAILDVDDATGQRQTLALLGPSGSFPAGTLNLHQDLTTGHLFRLDPGLSADSTVDAIEVSRIYLSDTVTGLAKGDLLLFTGKNDAGLAKLVLRAVAVVAEPNLKRLRVDLEPLPAPGKPLPPPAVSWYVPYGIKPVLQFAQAKIAAVPFTSNALATTVTAQVWRESDLQAMIGIQGWSKPALVTAISSKPGGPPIAPEAGVFNFRVKLGFFGNNAPKWAILPTKAGNNIHAEPYAKGWDAGDSVTSPAEALPRTIWTDSQGNPILPHAYLERPVSDVTRTSWVVFDAPEAAAQAYGVFDVRETSRADYGLSGRAMAITLADDSGNVIDPPPATNFPFRSTTAHVASQRLDLIDLPIDSPVGAGDMAIELDQMVVGLSVGQAVALTGELDDLHGVNAAEIAILADIIHANGRSTLMLRRGLTNSYRRDSLRISANVVKATHGETVHEVLGNGNSSIPNQSFVLKKPPTTFVSAATPTGVQSTLKVRVAGVLWDEVPSLYGAAADQLAYTTRIGDDAAMNVTFGDGVQGARLPTGTVNVAARYRSGIGPDGEVAAGTLTMLRAMPLGLRGVTNPVPASGAEGPEQLVDARQNAPLTLLTFERVVSLLDYENFARGYPGIGKARADVPWVDGAPVVFLTVAAATGGPPNADVLSHLVESISGASDPSQRCMVGGFVQRYFRCTAELTIDPRYIADDVLASASTVLQTAFGFAARALGKSVTAAEVVTMIHTVAGVVAVHLTELAPYSDDPAPTGPVPAGVPAFGAIWDPASRTMTAAELLLINPAAISLTKAQS